MARLIILRILETYFRHRWLYLLPIVLMVAAAAVFIYAAKPKYQSQGVLYVQQESLLASMTAVTNNDGSWWMTPSQATANQMNELLQTDAFVRAVIQQTDLEAEMQKGQTHADKVIKETRKAVWVASQGDNQVLVGAAHEQPEVSYQLVHGIIEGYIQWQVNAQRAESQSAYLFFADLLQRYETDLNAAREAMRDYLRAHPEPLHGERPSLEQLELARLQSEIDVAAARYASTLDKEENAQLSLAQIESDARQTYLLIDAPRLPIEPSTSLKQLAINAAIFIAAGLVLSAGAIVGAAVLDSSFRFPIDIEQRLRLPVLATLPDTTAKRPRFARFRQRQPVSDPAPGKVKKQGQPKSPKPRWKPISITLQINHNNGNGSGQNTTQSVIQDARQEQATL